MRFSLRDQRAFTDVTVDYLGVQATIPNVVIDTGSAVTVLSADMVAAVGITPAPHDALYTVRGIGGVEVVFSRRVDGLLPPRLRWSSQLTSADSDDSADCRYRHARVGWPSAARGVGAASPTVI